MKKHPFLDYQLDELGNVYDMTGLRLEPKLYGEDAYYVISIYHVHRLMAETYLGLEKDSRLIVNHKDGIKRNSWLTNLELTTHSGNIIHAYETGLRDDNHPVLVKNLTTGAIKRFISINACAKSLSVNNATIALALLPRNYGKVWNDIYILARECDGLPVDIRIDNNGKVKAVVIVEDNGHVKVFAKVVDAAKYLSVKVVNLRARLLAANRKAEKSVRYLDKLAVYKDNYLGDLTNAEFVDESLQERFRVVRKPLSVTVSYDSGETAVYKSLAAFCEEKGLSHGAVSKAVWKNGRYQDMEISYHRPLR